MFTNNQSVPWLERKYILQLCSRYRNFKQVSQNLFNFSCPLCGDSDKNPKKSRGYVYLKPKENRYHYHCHNCSISTPFDKFLKDQDYSLHAEFLVERFKETKSENQLSPKAVPFIKKVKVKELSGLKSISQLQPNHPVKKYVMERRIPTTFHHKLYFVPKFKEFVNTLISGKFSDISLDEPRILIPFIDKSGNLFGFQGREPEDKKNGLRYITIMLDESKPRLYGLDSVDLNRRHYVLEGPIDSMFIPNSIASAGGEALPELFKLGGKKENAVILMDNEKRNPDTVKKMQKAVAQGFKIVIWPDNVSEKDVNKWVQSFDDKISLDKIQGVLNTMLEQNTFSGMDAELRLIEWKR